MLLEFTLPSGGGEGSDLNHRAKSCICVSDTDVSHRMQLHLQRCRAQRLGGGRGLVETICQGAGQSLDVGNGEDLDQDLLSSAEFHVGYVMAGKQSKKLQSLFYDTNAKCMLDPAVNANPNFSPNAVGVLSQVLQFHMS